MFFLTPRHVKIGRQYVKDARKLLAYKRDLWSEATVVDVEKHIDSLEGAIGEKDPAKISAEAEKLDKVLAPHVPVHSDGWLRENVEVFLVAIVVALGVRTYFLQPFTIPTGSMQPTLNGIVFHPTQEPAPNVLVRALQVPIFGRHYVDQVAKEREKIAEYRPVKSPLPFVPRVPGLAGSSIARRSCSRANRGGSAALSSRRRSRRWTHNSSERSIRRRFMNPER
jgi:signal peptidase I